MTSYQRRLGAGARPRNGPANLLRQIDWAVKASELALTCYPDEPEQRSAYLAAAWEPVRTAHAELLDVVRDIRD